MGPGRGGGGGGGFSSWWVGLWGHCLQVYRFGLDAVELGFIAQTVIVSPWAFLAVPSLWGMICPPPRPPLSVLPDMSIRGFCCAELHELT